MCVCVCMCVCYSLSHVWVFETPWTVACQALLSVGFSRQVGCHALLQGSLKRPRGKNYTHTHTHTYTHRQALSLPCKILQSSEGQIRKKGNHHPLWWNNIDSRYKCEGRIDKLIGFNWGVQTKFGNTDSQEPFHFQSQGKNVFQRVTSKWHLSCITRNRSLNTLSAASW